MIAFGEEMLILGDFLNRCMYYWEEMKNKFKKERLGWNEGLYSNCNHWLCWASILLYKSAARPSTSVAL